MRLLRGLAGALLWIGAALLGLVGVLLCVTVILLPVGIPLLRLAGKSFAGATRLMLPRSVAHPVAEARRSWRKKARDAKDATPDVAPAELVSKGRTKVAKGRKKVVKKTKGGGLLG